MAHNYTFFRNFLRKTLSIFIICAFFLGNFSTIAQAKIEIPPEEYRGDPVFQEIIEGSAVIQEESFGIAWGDPDGPHSVYDWPFDWDQMGLVIQSYQNYSSGISSAYFHHGIDMVAPNGTAVYNRSGGQVVNIENYQPGNSLYWEVAILDPEGYVWQYHHIDQPTIPDLIYDKFAEWQADPVNGGFIPPNTRIGNIIYWPVVSLGYRFNHIHLNILADGDVYLNGLEFHHTRVDDQIPEIQEIGLLNGDTVVSGNTASGNYGMYVRARDLFESPVYYLPPHKTEFSIDGGDWVTVWDFHSFPGGFNDEAYVNDFFVPYYTQGDYEDRDFYIDLGFTTSGQRSFPSEPGEHTIEVRVWDYYGNNTSDTFTWNVVSSLPDNGCASGNGITQTFEISEDLLVTDVNLGVNISHATRGQVRVTLQSPTDTSATTIINTSSDTYDNYDVWVDDSSSNSLNDGNNDTVAEPYFDRTAGPSSNGALDSFIGKTTFGEWTVFVCDNTSGTTGTVNLIDLEVIGMDNDNTQPIAYDDSFFTSEDTPTEITLTGFDEDEDPLTFIVTGNPAHGLLSGTAPALTYTPDPDFNGTDSLTFVVNDGAVNSVEATITIDVTPVNDPPVADDQSLTTEQNTPISITLTGSDIDGDSIISYSVVTPPSQGDLSGSGQNLTYTPYIGYTGTDSFTFTVSDGALDSDPATVSITVNPPGPMQIFWDDFETDLGWDEDPFGSDNASTGMWERANPEGTDSSGSVMQLGNTVSGSYDLVTGGLAGSGVGSYDIDNGDTTILSPEIYLPTGRELTLSFFYYLAHLNNASSDDYLRVSVLGDTNQLVFEELGAGNTDIASWANFSVDISNFAGQTIQLLIEAADASGASLVEAAVDDILIEGILTNNPPVANPDSVTTDEDTALGITLTGSDLDGDDLSYEVTANPTHGSLTGTAPDLTYTPEADFNGADSFTFVVNDGTVNSDPAVVSITVNAVNDAPVADDQSVSTAEDTPVAITLTGSDVDEDTLNFAVSSGPSHGSLSGSAPDLIYTPSDGYVGSDSFSFTVFDGTATSIPATVSITVTEVNDPPTADDQEVDTNEDSSVAITLTGSDPEGQDLSFVVLTQPSNGTLSGTAPDLTYTPNTDYNGSDSFTFKVNDGELDSDPSTVSINVDTVNDAPVADDQSVSGDEDNEISITLTGSDVEGSGLSFSVESQPTNGDLSGTAQDLTYTPDVNFSGSDSFTFKVNDGELDSELATVSITVNSVNDVPVADGQSVSTDEDTVVSITLTGSDIDGDSLTYIVLSGPTSGILSGEAPDLTYSPGANFHGADSFTFVVNDGTVDSDPATVSITVNAVNDAPVAESQSISTSQDTLVAITLTGSDVDEDTLSFAVSSGPSHGSLSGTAPDLTYTPVSGYVGPDSFSFTVSDGILTSNPATVSITITDVNDPPSADNQTVVTDEDTPVAITLTGSDPEGQALSFIILTEPANGALSGTAPDLTYTPDANSNGSDNFTFKVNDGELDSDPATISITVNPVNDAPVADSQSVSTQEDTPITITLTGSDVDTGDVLTFSITSGPSHGTLTGSGAAREYTPDSGYSGPDSFTFVVNDGTVDSAPATVSITVIDQNYLPVVYNQEVSTDEDQDLSILLTWFDQDGDEVTFEILSGPDHGSLSGDAPDLVYSPEADFNGEDSFTFQANDGIGDSNIGTITITVDPVNDAPIADDQSVAGDEDNDISITLTGSDVDGSGLSFSVQSQPTNGDLSGTAPDLTYTPDENFYGTDSFTFKVNDGEFDSGLATVSITVNPVNDVPLADDKSVTTDEDTPLAITLTGSDVESTSLSFSIETGPAHGDLTGTAPELTYTPDANFNGADSFTFVVNDGSANSDPATISITVNPVNDAPVADDQGVTTEQDYPIDITLSGSDVEGTELSFIIVGQPSNGTLTENFPEVTYTPDVSFTGEDSFTFVVSDGELESEEATVMVTITPAGPTQLFWDDFETNLGWVVNPYGNDTATTGQWERANPEGVDYNGLKQLGNTVSGSNDLVTGPLAGRSAGDYDIDGGITRILSPEIELPAGRTLNLSFYSYLAHASNASTADFLRVSVIGTTTEVVFEDLGGSFDDDAVWELTEVNLSAFGGQTIQLLIEAADAGSASLVEAGVDDVLIMVERPNDPPVADPQSLSLAEDEDLTITLTGSDPDGDPLTFEIVDSPQHGSLSGSLPNITYTPEENYDGADSFSFLVNDGNVASDPAIIDLEISSVNDAPVAEPQSVMTQVDTAVAISLIASDVDEDPLNFILVSQPGHGDLTGDAPDLMYTPDPGYIGGDSFTFKVSDGTLESDVVTVDITVNSAGPLTVFFDDFETNKGWIVNPDGTDTATAGIWERAVPSTVSISGPKQLAAYSGSYDLVTGPDPLRSWWWWTWSVDDINDGVTSVRSPNIALPSANQLTLSFMYYLAHDANSSADDFLRVRVIGTSSQVLQEEFGGGNNDDAQWAPFSVDLNAFAGQTVYLLIDAADWGSNSLVEAAIDDVLIIAE